MRLPTLKQKIRMEKKRNMLYKMLKYIKGELSPTLVGRVDVVEQHISEMTYKPNG
jgi:hypothetical protein